MQLSAGVHFMQVPKWLGHSSYVLTLSTYADYISEDELAAPKLAPSGRSNTGKGSAATAKGALVGRFRLSCVAWPA